MRKYVAARGITGVYDLHSHLLPGIDDGAENPDESYAMLHMAWEEGTRVIAATPHLVLDGDEEAYLHRVARRLAGLRRSQSPEYGVHIVPGFELFLDEGIFGCADLTWFTLGHSPVLLFETAPQCLWELVRDAVLWMLERGVIPVMAHPERSLPVPRVLPPLRALCEKGLILQINSGSITGAGGRAVRRNAERLARSGLPVVLGSDAHSVAARPPLMQEALHTLQGWIGRERTIRAAIDLPRFLLEKRPENLRHR